jgi:hypothetical protein
VERIEFRFQKFAQLPGNKTIADVGAEIGCNGPIVSVLVVPVSV